MNYATGDYVCLLSGYCARVIDSRRVGDAIEYLIAGPTGTRHGALWAQPYEMKLTFDGNPHSLARERANDET